MDSPNTSSEILQESSREEIRYTIFRKNHNVSEASQTLDFEEQGSRVIVYESVMGLNSPAQIEYHKLSSFSNEKVNISVFDISYVARLPPKTRRFVSNTDLKIVQTLPEHLEYLHLQGRQLSYLPVLPEQLKVLALFNVSVPIAKIPQNLIELTLYNVTTITFSDSPEDPQLNVLGISVETMIHLQSLSLCQMNHIDPKKIRLPPQLKDFIVKRSGWKTLPELPPGLKFLDCSGNPLKEIRDVPLTLTTLKINDCEKLRKLLFNPKSFCGTDPGLVGEGEREEVALERMLKLTVFGMDHCVKLSKWFMKQKLPESLKSLKIIGANITSIPSLPTDLRRLWCSNNPLQELPHLPGNLERLYINKTNLQRIWIPRSLKKLLCFNSPNLYFIAPNPPEEVGYQNRLSPIRYSLINYEVYQRFYSTFVAIRAKRMFLRKVRLLIARRKALARKVSDLIDYAPGGKYARPSEQTLGLWTPE